MYQDNLNSVNSKNPLEIARKLGLSVGGELGEKGIVECELAYALKLLPKFYDDPIIRLNQHVLLYWQAGYFKSTILKVFSETVPAYLKPKDLTSMTFEKIFGSINEKTGFMVPPVFTNQVKFVIIPEMTTILGQKESMKQVANTLNLVLEGERVSRQTLKLGQGEPEIAQIKKLKEMGVDYDYSMGELAYTPDVCLLAGTRPLENIQFTYLDKSGHLGRYHVIQHRITDEEAIEYLRKDFKIDIETRDTLQQLNSRLGQMKISKVLRPTETFMAPIYDDLEAIIKDEITETRLTLSEIINPRLKGNIIRELVAHAFLRTATQNDFSKIDQLEYTEQDTKFILNRLSHFIDFTLNPLIAASLTIESKKPSKNTQCKTIILNCLEDGQWHQSDEIIEKVEEHFQKNSRKICGATIYISLSELEKHGKILHEHGQCKLADPKDKSH